MANQHCTTSESFLPPCAFPYLQSFIAPKIRIVSSACEKLLQVLAQHYQVTKAQSLKPPEGFSTELNGCSYQFCADDRFYPDYCLATAIVVLRRGREVFQFK